MDFEQKKILSILSSEPRPLMITEIASLSAINRHTVARKLDTLELLGRVRKIEIGNAKKYYITKAISVSSLIDISNDLILVLNENWEIQYINLAAQQHFNLSEQIINGKKLDLLHLEIFSSPEIMNGLKEFSFQKISKIKLSQIKNGTEQWYEISIMNISLRPGSISIAVIASNITEKYLIEQKLIENEAMFRSLFDYAPIPITETDYSRVKNYLDELKKNGIVDLKSYFDQNPEALKTCLLLIIVLNINKQSQKDYPIMNGEHARIMEYLLPFFTKETWESYRNHFIALYEGSEFFRFTTTLVNPKGTTRYYINYISVASPFHDLSRVYVSYLDITEQYNNYLHVLRTNKDLISVTEEIIAHDSEIQKQINKLTSGHTDVEKINSLYNHLLNATKIPMIMWDSSLVIIWVSNALNEFCGYTYSCLIGQPLELLFPEDLKSRQVDRISISSCKSDNGFMISLLHQSGSIKTVNWRFVEKIMTSDGVEKYAAILNEL